MITIFIFGLDQFVVGRLSREMTPSLARLYEVEEEEVNFVGPSTMVFHNGVEQTSWNVLVKVDAPMKVSVLQDQVAAYIFSCLTDLAINASIEFDYYSQNNRYTNLNPDYPRYITGDNLVEAETEEYDEDLEEGDEDDQLYSGDIFENFEGK